MPCAMYHLGIPITKCLDMLEWFLVRGGEVKLRHPQSWGGLKKGNRFGNNY